MVPPLTLRPPRPGDGVAALAAHAALREEDGMDFLLFFDPAAGWDAHLAQLEDRRLGRALPEGRVAETFLFAVVVGEVVGRVSIRHSLTPWLRDVGGHIGYSVVPGQRRRGHATEMLRQGLIVARSLGIDEVRITCDDANVASARVIESNGGVLEDVVPLEGGRLRRYWIR